MESFIELWYLNSVAIIVAVVSLAVVGYIWYDAKEKQLAATNWLGIGGLSLALTLPSAWIALSLGDVDKMLLQTYLERVRTSPELLQQQDIISILENLAVELGMTQVATLDYQNLQLFLYLSLAGLIGSVVAGVGYYRSDQGTVGTFTPEPFSETYQLPPTAVPPTPPPPMTPPPVTTAKPPPQKPSVANRGATPLDRTKLINEPAQVVAWLVIRDGSRQGKGYPLGDGETLIGRDGQHCQVVLDHETISGQHAKIKKEQKSFWLYDLASTNGTFLNDRQIQRQRLEDGDKVRLGALKFIFKEVR